MAHILPFRAFRYAPAKVSVSQAVTQPYDKITPAMQKRYYDASPYNLVRIILGLKEATDGPASNVYTRAAKSFQDWRTQGVLEQDTEPSLYLYVQKFTPPGGAAPQERRGFIALGRIEDYSAGVVFRHEQTLAKPKADRLDLLRNTRGHFGQIFMLYTDPAREVDALLTPSGSPAMQTTDEYGVLHQVWKVSDPAVIQQVQDRMKDKKLIIADGHHRYETALNYRNERRAAAGTGGPSDAPYESVMMTLVNMDSPGLVILPTHRVVHGLPKFSPDAFAEGAGRYFRVEQVDPTLPPAGLASVLRDAGRNGTALLAVCANRAFLLYNPKPADARVFAGFSPRQQSLDVVQLHKALLESVLGLSEESVRNQENISYIRDAEEAISMFLMNPAKMEQIRDIAFGGEVLPQKSTDFFPKMLSGLTIYALE
jgi:uncharacterized protein (DUF1015 family)